MLYQNCTEWSLSLLALGPSRDTLEEVGTRNRYSQCDTFIITVQRLGERIWRNQYRSLKIFALILIEWGLIQIFTCVLCVTIISLGFPRVSRDFTFLTLDFTFLTPQWCEQENEFGQTTTSWDVLCRSGSNFNFSKYKYPFESDGTFFTRHGM